MVIYQNMNNHAQVVNNVCHCYCCTFSIVSLDDELDWNETMINRSMFYIVRLNHRYFEQWEIDDILSNKCEYVSYGSLEISFCPKEIEYEWENQFILDSSQWLNSLEWEIDSIDMESTSRHALWVYMLNQNRTRYNC
jgi:hypothetical protein